MSRIKQLDLSKQGLSYIISEYIMEQIITGELKAGDKLIESQYAEQFGTSRAPIREAFILLTNQGLLEKIPRKGTVVRGYTKADISDILELRIVLEEMAMSRIIERGIISDCVLKMEGILIQMHVNQNKSDYTKLNYLFHQCIIDMAGSSIIKKMYEGLGISLLGLQSLTFSDKQNVAKSIKDHRVIVSLLKENQAGEVAALLQQHNKDLLHHVKRRIHAGMS